MPQFGRTTALEENTRTAAAAAAVTGDKNSAPLLSTHSLGSNEAVDAEREALGMRMRRLAIGVVLAYMFLLPIGAAGAWFFLHNTVMMFNPPSDDIVGRTQELSNKVFLKQTFHNPVLILVHSKNRNVPVTEAGGGQLCQLTDMAAAFPSSLLTHVVGYCPYASVNATVVADNFVTADRTASLVTVDFRLGETISATNGVQQELMNAVTNAVDTRFHALTVQYASVGLVSGDLETGLVKDLLTIDAISIPCAFLALALCLHSVRTPILPGIVIPVVVCCAFGICYLISLGVSISSFAPEMASATVMAITIDYSLFILSRFRELAPRYELLHGSDGPYVRYLVCFETAKRSAHNIVVSGMTVAVALGGLVLMSVKFIGTIGYVFFVACVCAVIISLTLMPSILLIFYVFFRKETDFGAIIRCLRRKFASAHRDESKTSPPRTASSGGVAVDSPTDRREVSMKTDSRLRAYSDVEKDIKDLNFVGGYTDHAEFEDTLRKQQESSFWFKLGLFAYRRPYPVILAVLLFGAPFCYFTTQLKVDFDLFNQVPRDSPHGKILKYIISDVGHGAATPFFITLDSGRPGTITVNDTISAKFFERTQQLVHHLSAATGQPISQFSTFAMLLGAPLYPFEAALLQGDPNYAVLWNMTVDPTGRAGIIRLVTTFNPFGAAANEFLNKLDRAIENFDTQGDFKIGLMGASAVSWAVMRKVLSLFPMQIGITFGIIFVIIALVFRSIYIPFRMVFTVAYTVAVSLGAGVIFFQYDWSHSFWVPMRGVQSYSWTVPIFAFSLLCALALDYDVFILTRLVELRQLGFGPEAAMAKAVWRTGRIISFAGIIMAISFGSMVFSNITMLNQFGFICAFAVLLDTFMIRGLFVPALMSVFPTMAWWPRRFPEPDKGLEDMVE